MKTIQILGTGCPKCKQLAENTAQAITAAGLDAHIEKVTQIAEIMKFGVMLTPALAIDGVVKCMGKVLTVDEIKELLR
jgi:small redox-active disulfide protein 2